jgi:cytosine/adenosine deaminase-related metal-dependent hydrolase
MKILTANYVLPIVAPPIERGAVAINGSEIIAVGKRGEIIEQFPNTDIENFGEAAILPGFVNCHSHLEITSMRGALDDVEHDFSAWLLKLNDIRSKLSDKQIRDAAVAGAVEGIQAGVTCFGDIGRYGIAGFEALKSTGLRGVLFQETEFSADDVTAESDFRKLIDRFESLRETETELVKVGISPHSPYTK